MRHSFCTIIVRRLESDQILPGRDIWRCEKSIVGRAADGETIGAIYPKQCTNCVSAGIIMKEGA